MPRKNRRNKSDYRHKLGFDPMKYVKGGDSPKVKLDKRSVQKLVYENKPSLDRHKAHVRTSAEQRAISGVRDPIRQIELNAIQSQAEMKRAAVTPCRMEIWYANLGNHGPLCVQNGIRPVLILSNDISNEKAPIVTVIPMSSNTSRLYLHSHVLVESEQVELTGERRFFHAGVLYLEQMTTIDKVQLMDRVGRISDAELLERINAAVMEHLMITVASSASVELVETAQTEPNENHKPKEGEI